MNKSKVYSHIANGLKPLYEPYRKQGRQFIVLFKNRQAKAVVPFDQYEKQLARYDDYKTLSRELKNGEPKAYEEMIARNLPPKKKDVTRYINVVTQKQPADHYTLLKFTTADDKVQYLTMTPFNTAYFRSFLQDAFKQTKKEYYGSDFMTSYIVEGFKGITHEYISVDEIKQRLAENRNGRYFNAVNKTAIDLSEYQIFNQEYYDNIKKERQANKFYEENIKHCIIHTLELQGIEKVKIQRVLTSFDNCFNFPISKLQDLAKAIERTIYLYTYDINDKIRCKKYEFEETTPLKMALYKNHYFIYNDSKYTKFSIENYEEIKDIENFNDIIKKRTDNNTYRHDKKSSKLNTLELVKKMNDLNMFDWSDKTLTNYRVEATIGNVLEIPLDDIENEQQLNTASTPSIAEKEIFIADLEAIVKDGTHKPFMSGIIKRGEKVPCVSVSTKPDCKKWFFGMMDYIIKHSKGEPIVYFHNLKYDFTVMLKHISPYYSVKKDGQYYETRIMFKGRKIRLRDSYKIISQPLRKFNKMFQLTNKKEEAINYAHYDYDNLLTKNSIRKYKKGLSKPDRVKFDEIMGDKKNAKRFEYDGKYFNALGFYCFYLKQDVMTLYEGLEKFNSLMYDLTKLNSYDYLTISKLATEFFISKGCFDEVFMCCGNLRSYLSNAVYGGRVNVQQSIKKMLINEVINDLDANSLYPASFDRMCAENTGLSKGKAKVITEEHKQYDNLKREEYYIVTVEITAIKKKQDNPFIQVKNSDGISDYINDLPAGKTIITTIDKTTLEDYIKFHEIEYKILKGVYYDGGFNNSIGPICKELYDERLRIKKANPAMAEMIKLILNSTYGKTISKKNFEKINYVKAKDFNDFVYKNFANIKGLMHKLNNDLYEITTSTIDDSYNFASVGIKCLSFSKRIMNEVMGLASDNGILIYYQDTDSMHIRDEDISRLEALYRKDYKNKELYGTGLGQFKSDFNILDENGDSLGYVNIKSIQSCFLGKKAYIDKLRGYDKEGNEHIDYHIRLKGVTEAGINHKVDEMGAIELYERLAKGEKIQFILNPSKHKVMFDFTKNSVHTRETRSFVREVCF